MRAATNTVAWLGLATALATASACGGHGASKHGPASEPTRLSDAYTACPDPKFNLAHDGKSIVAANLALYNDRYTPSSSDGPSVGCLFDHLKTPESVALRVLGHPQFHRRIQGHATYQGIQYTWNRFDDSPLYKELDLSITLVK